MPTPRVWNRRNRNAPRDAIYVGRPTIWGNPFRLYAEGERASVLAKYEAWLMRQPALLALAKATLRGHDLVCFCAPRPCHADILLRVANDLSSAPALDVVVGHRAADTQTDKPAE